MEGLKKIGRIKMILLVVQIALPFVTVLFSVLFLVMIGGIKKDVSFEGGNAVGEDVKKYSYVVSEKAEKYGISEYVRYLLAIMQVESGGVGVDVMQSLGNSGIPEEKQTADLSIEYGVAYFADLLERAKAAGCDMDTVIQAYNYGTGYIDYVAARGKKHDFDLACSFAAKKSGGKKVVYNNPLAVKINGGWRYEYGNMFYVYLVHEYLAVNPMDGSVADAIITEALKYKGWKYVWGGASPQTSFDCSGLVQWCFGTAGIAMPRAAQEQYDATQHISLEEAAPGDLVFFTGTTSTGRYITHVGIYVGDNKMFHAGNPIGYADLTGRYWQKHLVCAGRVK